MCYISSSCIAVLLFSQWWPRCRHSGRGCISWPTAWMYIWNMCRNISRYQRERELEITL